MDIILDMGNVLLEWNKDKILQSVSNTKKDYLILDKSIFQSGLWERLDLGTMTREELVLKLVSMIGRGYQKKVEEVIWNWPSYIDIYREVFPVLSELKKKGHRIFVLSNTSKVFYDLLEEQLSPLKELLDGFVLSCDIKAIKPDLAMFKGILDKYQLDPTNCVFLDDIEDNTIAAEKLGIKSYQVKKRSDVVDILKSYIWTQHSLFFVVESFFVNKILQNDIYMLH